MKKTPREMREAFDELLIAFGGLYTFDDIMECIANHTMQSFTVGDTWAITQVLVFPRKRVLEIAMTIGELSEVMELEKRIRLFAADIGADMIRAFGRKGWEKIALPDGWRPLATTYVLDM